MSAICTAHMLAWLPGYARFISTLRFHLYTSIEDNIESLMFALFHTWVFVRQALKGDILLCLILISAEKVKHCLPPPPPSSAPQPLPQQPLLSTAF